MKKQPVYACMALVALALGACQNAQIKQHLLQGWQYNLEATREEMRRRQTGLAEQSYMESIMSGLQYAQLYFQPRGVLEFRLDTLSQTGTWKLRKQGREISIRLAEQTQLYRLSLPIGDTLKLEPIQGPGLPFPRVLTKAP